MIYPLQNAPEFPRPVRTRLWASFQSECNAVWDSHLESLALVMRVSRRRDMMKIVAVAWKEVDLQRQDCGLVFVYRRLSCRVSGDVIVSGDRVLTACPWSSPSGTVCLVLFVG